jgi:hypothetical protein
MTVPTSIRECQVDNTLATSIRLTRPGGVRSVLAESVLLKHQLVILNRSRRAPNLPGIGPADRWIVRSTCSAKTAGSVGSRGETVNPAEFPSRAGSLKIPAAVFPKTQSETRTERIAEPRCD